MEKKDKKETSEDVKKTEDTINNNTLGIIILDHPELSLDNTKESENTNNSLPEDNVH